MSQREPHEASAVLRAGAGDGDPCPCGSGSVLARCCGPYLDGQPAPSAQALMRSRFTAYAVGDEDHLFRTWHPRTRPPGPYCHPGTQWLSLRIDEVVGGGAREADGAQAVVAFTARYRAWDGPWAGQGVSEGELVERSRFVRRAGRWLYVDGEVVSD